MAVQNSAAQEGSSFWRLVLQDLPADPFSIAVLILVAGFAYVVWRNLSMD